jgi:hypothetical protein
MADRVTWTASMDETLRQWRQTGATWDAIALGFGLGRETVRERGRRIGAPGPEVAIMARLERERADRPPFPPGHEISWGLLTRGTVLEGDPYPLPWFG